MCLIGPGYKKATARERKSGSVHTVASVDNPVTDDLPDVDLLAPDHHRTPEALDRCQPTTSAEFRTHGSSIDTQNVAEASKTQNQVESSVASPTMVTVTQGDYL